MPRPPAGMAAAQGLGIEGGDSQTGLRIQLEGTDMTKDRFPAAEGTTPVNAGSDRRKADRLRSVCRIARVLRDGDAGFWRVRNISDKGMMLAVDVPVAVGERLEIALSETVSFEASVVWTDKGRCGVQFSQAIDAAALLAGLAAEQRATSYRAPRIAVEARAELMLDKGVCPIDLIDISQSGAGFLCSEPLAAGMKVELVLLGGLRRTAIVRWSRGGRGGLWFQSPLDRSDAESLAWLSREGCPRPMP